MTISIGQYLPGNSIVHRADPRTKILLTIIFMVGVFLVESFIGYAFLIAFTALMVIAAKIPFRIVLKSLKPVIIIVIFTFILNLFFHAGSTELFNINVFDWFHIIVYWESVFFSIKMALRIITLMIGASILTYTTTSVMLTDGLESLMKPLKVIRFPVHEIAMMMSIALRFIPIFADETDRIMKAQTARGSDFDSKKLGDRIKAFVPILIPLFVSAWRRAEELADAMNARCYRGGDGRTRYRTLKFGKADVIVSIAMLILLGIIIVLRVPAFSSFVIF